VQLIRGMYAYRRRTTTSGTRARLRQSPSRFARPHCRGRQAGVCPPGQGVAPGWRPVRRPAPGLRLSPAPAGLRSRRWLAPTPGDSLGCSPADLLEGRPADRHHPGSEIGCCRRRRGQRLGGPADRRGCAPRGAACQTRLIGSGGSEPLASGRYRSDQQFGDACQSTQRAREQHWGLGCQRQAGVRIPSTVPSSYPIRSSRRGGLDREPEGHLDRM
jgi:hypothetical protein